MVLGFIKSSRIFRIGNGWDHPSGEGGVDWRTDDGVTRAWGLRRAWGPATANPPLNPFILKQLSFFSTGNLCSIWPFDTLCVLNTGCPSPFTLPTKKGVTGINNYLLWFSDCFDTVEPDLFWRISKLELLFKPRRKLNDIYKVCASNSQTER